MNRSNDRLSASAVDRRIGLQLVWQCRRRRFLSLDQREFCCSKTHETSVAIPATYARLKVGTFDEDQMIGQDTREVVFRVPLKAGSTRLQAWFVDGSGNVGAQTRGVYYVSVRREDNE